MDLRQEHDAIIKEMRAIAWRLGALTIIFVACVVLYVQEVPAIGIPLTVAALTWAFLVLSRALRNQRRAAAFNKALEARRA